jgi:hypothetical protein
MKLCFWAMSSSLRLRELYQHKFSIEAERLLSLELSDESLKTIGFLCNSINKNQWAFFLLIAISMFINDRFKGKPIRNRNADPNLSNLIAYWMYAVSYRSLLAGFLIRHGMSTLADPKVRDQWDRIIREKALRNNNCNHPNHAALAT